MRRGATRGLLTTDLVEQSGLEKRVVQAIARGQYVASPKQRRQLAAALGLEPEQIQWGHAGQVDHLYGHGPQFGRSP